MTANETTTLMSALTIQKISRKKYQLKKKMKNMELSIAQQELARLVAEKSVAYYTEGYLNLEFNKKKFKLYEKTSLHLLAKLGYLDKYLEIVELIKNLKQIEFKGNNQEGEFAMFNDLAAKISANVYAMPPLIDILSEFQKSMQKKQYVDFLKEEFIYYDQQDGGLNNLKFYKDFLNIGKISLDRI